MISESTVQQILEAARVEEVVGEFVRLKRAGSNLKGLCPFHNEKTPSFMVNPARGIYKCFGCDAKGNSVNFLMQHEKLSYPEALRWLAAKYSISVEEDEVPDAAQIASRQKAESVMIANGFAQKFFSNYMFRTDEGRGIGLSYFKERGFTDETIHKFELGFSPDDKHMLVNEMLNNGFVKEIIEAASLGKQTNGDFLSFFRARAMFPVHNLAGKVIAFGARALHSGGSAPKYINTAESEVYQKSKILYGLFFARAAIAKADNSFLVEGYTDVISMHQAGIENVVASSGTALTADQVRLLRRYSDNITVLFDGDAAGMKAAMRGIEIILKEGGNVKLVLLPPEHDPDSFIHAYGASGFYEYVKRHAVDFLHFKLRLLMKEAGDSPAMRAGVVGSIVESIALIDDPLKRLEYIKDCSQMLRVTEDVITAATNRERRENYSRDQRLNEADKRILDEQFAAASTAYQPEILSALSDDFQERDIIRLIFEYGNLEIEQGVTVADFVLNELEIEAMENKKYRELLSLLKREYATKPVMDQKYFLNHPVPDVSRMAIEMLQQQYEVSPNWQRIHDIAVTDKSFITHKDIASSVNRFRLRKVLRFIEQIMERVRAARTAEEQLHLMQIQQQLLEKKKELAILSGNTVVVK